MKFILAVTCASITAMSLGIALYHKQSLNTPQTALQPQIHSSPFSYKISATSPTQQVTLPSSALHSEHIEHKLLELIEQQEAMRVQQSEINKEINSILFRLDTHSASFRPIRMEQDSTPPSQGNATLPTPLLPPLQQ